jgi:hypothetical protein
LDQIIPCLERCESQSSPSCGVRSVTASFSIAKTTSWQSTLGEFLDSIYYKFFAHNIPDYFVFTANSTG